MLPTHDGKGTGERRADTERHPMNRMNRYLRSDGRQTVTLDFASRLTTGGSVGDLSARCFKEAELKFFCAGKGNGVALREAGCAVLIGRSWG